MKKVLFHLTERQIKSLKKESKAKGIPMAELVRRILDDYIECSNSTPNQ